MSTGPNASVNAETAVSTCVASATSVAATATCPPAGPQGSRGLVEHVGTAGDQRNPSAAIDREPRRREPDATRAPRDEHVRIPK